MLVSAEIPGIEALASSFRRSAGGPGVVVLLAETGSPDGAGGLRPTTSCAKPFTDQDLVAVVRRILAARRDWRAPRRRRRSRGRRSRRVRLTSRDIFGDMLAEVEGQFVAGHAGGRGESAADRRQAAAAPRRHRRPCRRRAQARAPR